MILAKVIGTVVADARVSTMSGQLLRLVQLLDGRTLEPQGGIHVAAIIDELAGATGVIYRSAPKEGIV